MYLLSIMQTMFIIIIIVVVVDVTITFCVSYKR